MVLAHPYRGLPGSRFWRTAVAEMAAGALDPVVSSPFTIGPDDQVATAGSCFAQHIAAHLRGSGFRFLQTEPAAVPDGPVFSATFGNIYTVRQLHQLLARAYGLMQPAERAWMRADGRFIDPFRPQLFPAGFATADAVEAARRRHFPAVQAMFEQADVLVFTLGLTEAWLAADGTALPVPPGAVATAGAGEARFHNFTVAEMRADMEAFLSDLRAVNPDLRVILTVSPVPLVATYEDRHVLTANAYSKAALRVLAEETAAAHGHVCYFPSYEIITATASAGYFADDCREIRPEGVAHVMRVFTRHFMSATTASRAQPEAGPVTLTDEQRRYYDEQNSILCDEILLDEAG